MQIIARLSGDGLLRFRTKIAGLENAAPIIAQSLNETGRALRVATVVAESAQAGLPREVIDRAQHTLPATSGRLAFTIIASGGDVRLKYFGAKEGGGGVTAHPWGRDSFYAGAFMTSGKASNRKPAPKLNGQVYTNVSGGKWKGTIKQWRSGLFIPTEMTRGATVEVFESGAQKAFDAVMMQICTRIAE